MRLEINIVVRNAPKELDGLDIADIEAQVADLLGIDYDCVLGEQASCEKEEGEE